MQGALRSDFESRTFRTSRAYGLATFDALPAPSASALARLRRENPGLEAVLVPRHEGRSVKVVGGDVARLLRRLSSPGPVTPRRGSAAPPRPPAIARLVLDGVLEVRVDGAFLSGPGALSIVFEKLPEPASGGATTVLSLDALRYAEGLEATDAEAVADRLYRFNRKPLSPTRRRMFPTERAVAERWGLDASLDDEDLAGVAERSRPGDPHWVRWRTRGRGEAPERAIYKLYLSPDPSDLRPALRAAASLFRDGRPPLGMKAARTLSGVLRPDKLVVYFGDHDELERAADRLRPRVGGLVPHGVPFTADWTGDGLLSWGVDPPPARRLPGWRRDDSSWRAWLSTRLAAALLVARPDGGAAIPPWRFALARIALEGIDPTTWAPDPAAWESSP